MPRYTIIFADAAALLWHEQDPPIWPVSTLGLERVVKGVMKGGDRGIVHGQGPRREPRAGRYVAN